jgi:hypothetical protein
MDTLQLGITKELNFPGSFADDDEDSRCCQHPPIYRRRMYAAAHICCPAANVSAVNSVIPGALPYRRSRHLLAKNGAGTSSLNAVQRVVRLKLWRFTRIYKPQATT